VYFLCLFATWLKPISLKHCECIPDTLVTHVIDNKVLTEIRQIVNIHIKILKPH